MMQNGECLTGASSVFWKALCHGLSVQAEGIALPCKKAVIASRKHLRFALPSEVTTGALVFLDARDAASCDAVSPAWHVDGIEAWHERCKLVKGEVHGVNPKLECAEAVRIARQSLHFRIHGNCKFLGADCIRPAVDKPWIAFIGKPSFGRRFVALKVSFRWSWCCQLGVMKAPGDSSLTVREILDANLWCVTARPPSRYGDGTLAIEGLNDARVDVNLWPPRPSFVDHKVEGHRQATFGILIDHGSVSFFMLSSGGRWASTGVVAESASALVPFVAHPVQEVELLGMIEAPQLPSFRHEKAIASFKPEV
mmetsp:Transcript_130126/g.236427  ORF Transcript_130126/g.236427 Transcript_130126/m.236427 type:complete len:310 (+) Transcript_130126:43-972(+)